MGERLRAEKQAEMQSARKEEGMNEEKEKKLELILEKKDQLKEKVKEEQEKTLESIQEKRDQLLKLKEQLAEQQNIMTRAKQEMREAQEMEKVQAFVEAGTKDGCLEKEDDAQEQDEAFEGKM